MMARRRFCVRPETTLPFPEVRASQVGGHFAGEHLYTTGIARLTEDVIVQRIAATAVCVG